MSLSFASAALAALSLMAQDGNCTAPQMPAQLRITPPAPLTVPACINVAANTSTCDEAVNTQYNAAVVANNEAQTAFQTQAQGYLREMRDYAMAANAYFLCEQSYYVALSQANAEAVAAANRANSEPQAQ